MLGGKGSGTHHGCAGVAAEGTLKDARELAVAVRNVACVALGKLFNDLSKSEERLVDVSTLYLPRSCRIGVLHALGPGKVHQVQHGHLHGPVLCGLFSGERVDLRLTLYDHLKDGVTTAGTVIHRCGSDPAALLTKFHQRQDTSRVAHDLLLEAVDKHATLDVLVDLETVIVIVSGGEGVVVMGSQNSVLSKSQQLRSST